MTFHLGAEMRYDDLVNRIREALTQYGYKESPELLLGVNIEGVVFSTPRRLIRNVCGIFAIPDDCDSFDKTKNLVKNIRKHLTSIYIRPPYLKELGSFFVFICKSGLYEDIQNTTQELVDKTGMHMNVIFGVVIVDSCRFKYSPASAWALSFSKKHFNTITCAIDEWCKIKSGIQSPGQ